MHGTILVLFNRFVVATYGPAVWLRLLAAAGLAEDAFEMKAVYPDRDLATLAQAAAEYQGCGVPALHEQFGEFLVPDLLRAYHHLVAPGWRTMELLTLVETHLHQPIRAEAPGITPPVLHAERLSPAVLRIHYVSERRMSALAVGIVRGVARHFGELDALRITSEASDDGRHVDILIEDLRVRAPAPTSGY